MPRAATAFVEFEGDFSKIKRGADAQAKKLEGTFNSSFKSIAKGAALSLGAVGAGKLLKSAFSEAEESQKVAKQTQAVIKSTGGAAGISAKHVDTLAGKLSDVAAVDDELIASAENVLLTFGNVKGDAFDEATKAALNMSAALGTDLQGSVIQVGKALNDPIKGVTALQRVGVSFTKSQRDQIKTLVESGDVLGAQKLILKELGKEFGGAAKAAATPSKRLQVAIGNLEEALGKFLLPAVTKIANGLADLSEWFVRNQTVIMPFVAALGTMFIITKIANAIKAFREAMVVLNSTFLANPVVLVVAAIAALGAAVFLAYKHFGPFHDAVDKAWQILQSLFHWVQANWPLLLAILTGPIGVAVLLIVRNFDSIKGFVLGAIDFVKEHWPLLLAILTGPIGLAVLAIATHWETIKHGFSSVRDWIGNRVTEIVGFFVGLPGKIAAVTTGLWDGLLSGLAGVWGAIERIFASGLNVIIDIINTLIRGWNLIPFHDDIKPLGHVHWAEPKPLKPPPGRFSHGGVVTGPMLGLLGENPLTLPEVVSPIELMRQVFAEVLVESNNAGARSIVGVAHQENHFEGRPLLEEIDVLNRKNGQRVAIMGRR